MPFHSTTLFTSAYLLPLSLAHLPQQKHNLNLLSSITKALRTHTLASFWMKQSCYTSAGDCRQRKWATVFKVDDCSFQQYWTYNAVASSRWPFPPNQRAATAFTRSRSMQTRRTLIIKHLQLQICICHRRSDFKSHRKKGNSWKSIAKQMTGMVSMGQPVLSTLAYRLTR